MRTLAAIMFTDIAGYTALMQRDEQEALMIRKIHRKHFIAITEKHRGKIIQYYGDGTLSMFNSAYQAVLCGIELQQAFQSSARQIPVRIGIHSGEIILETEDIIGDAVNTASRIESLAKVGSVLISEKIYDEIKNKTEFEVQPLGFFQFKNVFQPIEIYAMIEEGLYVPRREELQGKVQSEHRMHVLPAYHNAFIGRTHHIRAIRSLLERETVRLITLLGPGGMGKTRLSVKVGESMSEDFKHGVCFVPLDVVSDYTQTPLYIGHHLGIKKTTHNSWIEAITGFLQDKRLLLILDNLEQILESAEDIARILDTCPGVKILTTSREILGLSHETEYPLDSLNRPNPRLHPGPEELLKFDAVDLFVQKAQASQPGFQLDEINATTVVQICHLLDGLPLPIELAASMVKLFSPKLILGKLDQNTNLLKTRSRDVTQRHQTISNTVRWSYDLLDARDQRRFQQLSLFRNGFTPTALEAVCPDDDSLEVIESFLNKSLIVKAEEIHHVPRFRMLKLIRDFGLEQLDNNPDKDVYYRHFARYMISFIEQARPKLRGSQQAKWIALIEAEYENLLAAIDWLATNQPETAGRLGTAFWRFHLSRGFLREGLEMLEQLLALPIEANEIVAGLLEGAGVLSQNLGDYSKAKDYFRRSLELWKDLRNTTEVIKILNNAGWVEWRTGNYDHAVSYSENALQLSLELDHQHGQATALNNLAWIHFNRGRYEKVVELQRQILRMHKQLNNIRGIAFASINLGRALFQTGKVIEAEQLIGEGIRLFEASKDQQLIAFSWFIKAEGLCENGELETAKALLQKKCIPNFEKIGDSWGLAVSYNQLGSIYLQGKEFETAKRPLAKAMTLFRNSQDKFGEASTRLLLSRLHWAMGNASAAEKDIDRCLTLAASMSANELLMEAQLEMGRRALQQQSYQTAAQSFALADYFAEKLGAHRYDEFLAQIKPLLGPLRQYFRGENKGATAFNGQQWQLHEDHLPNPIEKEELNRRLSRLLDVSLSDLSPGSDAEPDLPDWAEDPFIRKVHRVIEQHLHDHNFMIKDLCREVGMSHSQLHRRLSEATGQSITKFIRSIRLEKAKELLADPELTVAAVAYDTGFKDPDYFHRVFKQTFQITPGEFRNSQNV